MKYFSVALVLMVLSGCINSNVEKPSPPIVEHTKENVMYIPDKTGNQNVIQEEKDDYIEKLVRKSDEILGVDVKHDENLVLAIIVFRASTTDAEIKVLLDSYISNVEQIYGDVIVHIQGVREGVNVYNVIRDITSNEEEK